MRDQTKAILEFSSKNVLIGTNQNNSYMRIGGGQRGELSTPLRSKKRLLVSDFWKIDKKF